MRFAVTLAGDVSPMGLPQKGTPPAPQKEYHRKAGGYVHPPASAGIVPANAAALRLHAAASAPVHHPLPPGHPVTVVFGRSGQVPASRGPWSFGATAEKRRKIVPRITEAVVLPFRHASTDSTETGRYVGNSGQKERQEADGEVVPFRMVPPTGFEPVPPP
jgi:hypothetical protein